MHALTTLQVPTTHWVQLFLLLSELIPSTTGYLPSRQFGHVRSTFGRCQSRFLGAKSPTTMTTSIQDGDESDNGLLLQKRRSLHEYVIEKDPEWYKEYVLDILGETICQSKWPAIIDYTRRDTNDEAKNISSPVPAQQNIATGSETASTSSNVTNQILKGTNITTILDSKASNDAVNSPISTTVELNVEGISMDSSENVQPTDVNSVGDQVDNAVAENIRSITNTTINSNVSSATNTTSGQDITLLLETNMTNGKDYVQDSDDTVPGMTTSESSDQPTSLNISSSTMNSATETLSRIEESNEIGMDSTKQIEKNRSTTTSDSLPSNSPPLTVDVSSSSSSASLPVQEPSSLASNETFSTTTRGIQNQSATEIDTPSMNSATSKKVQEIALADNAPTTGTANAGDETTTKVIVYRDSKQGWKSVELSVVLELGYIQDEIMELLPDALAIIVQEQIRRPRTLGLPAPWRIGPKETQACIRIVDNASLVDPLVATLNQEEAERRKKRPPFQGRSFPGENNTANPSPVMTRDDASDIKKKDKAVMDSNQRIPEPTIKPIAGAEQTRERERFDASNVDIDQKGINNPETYVKSERTVENEVVDQLTTNTTGQKDKSEVLLEESSTMTVDSEITGTNTDTKKVPMSVDRRIVLYKDLGNVLAAIPLENITCLGYLEEEIVTLQREALAIIVTDRVPRPRLGIPPQWRNPDSKEKPEVELVENMEEAQSRLEEDKAQRRRRRAAAAASTSSPGVAKDDVSDPLPLTNRKRSSQDIDSQGVEQERRTRPRSQRLNAENQIGERPPRRTVSVKGSQDRVLDARDDDEPTKRRQKSKRSEANDDGSPKRIYNARSLPNRRDREILPDPPDPNSPLWMDIESFRNLLRSEAELRLRILGDDWAPTVKQESDWRLGLYKKWLWTLHNGVGEPIVPPSRYERARKINEGRQRELSSDPDTSRKPPARKSVKRRPSDAR